LKFNDMQTQDFPSNPILSATFSRKIRTDGLCALCESGAGLKAGFGWV
jgi:hypothetical protein